MLTSKDSGIRILTPPEFSIYTEDESLELQLHTHKRMDTDSSSWCQNQCALKDEQEVPF